MRPSTALSPVCFDKSLLPASHKVRVRSLRVMQYDVWSGSHGGHVAQYASDGRDHHCDLRT